MNNNFKFGAMLPEGWEGKTAACIRAQRYLQQVIDGQNNIDPILVLETIQKMLQDGTMTINVFIDDAIKEAQIAQEQKNYNGDPRMGKKVISKPDCQGSPSYGYQTFQPVGAGRSGRVVPFLDGPVPLDSKYVGVVFDDEDGSNPWSICVDDLIWE